MNVNEGAVVCAWLVGKAKIPVINNDNARIKAIAVLFFVIFFLSYYLMKTCLFLIANKNLSSHLVVTSFITNISQLLSNCILFSEGE